MKYTALIVFIFIMVTLNIGCAVSYSKNEYQASYTVNDRAFDKEGVPSLYKNGDKTISMFTNCNDDSIYSWMMFPIIPLPPILPTFKTLDPPRISLGLHGEGFTTTSPKVSINQNGHVIEIDGMHEETSAWIYWYNPNNLSCIELDNATIRFSGILYNGKELELQPVRINVKDMGLSFDFEYYDQ